jgi:hypothetical protein
MYVSPPDVGSLYDEQLRLNEGAPFGNTRSQQDNALKLQAEMLPAVYEGKCMLIPFRFEQTYCFIRVLLI